MGTVVLIAGLSLGGSDDEVGSLALDKEEIFKRRQHRESELSANFATGSKNAGEKTRRDHSTLGGQIAAPDSRKANHRKQVQARRSEGATSSACCGK